MRAFDLDRALRDQLPDGRFRSVSPVQSRRMAAIKGKRNHSTETRLRLAFVRTSLCGWTLNPSDLLGKPDFYFAAARLAIFVDGCFWHGCESCCRIPSTNGSFWAAKIRRNIERDRSVTKRLRLQGISVMRFWEHQLQNELPKAVEQIRRAIRKRGRRDRRRKLSSPCR
jgi:DNA mismatch endonuclease (patch repair protein)